MYVPTNTPKYVCMACRNKIPIVDLEGIFLDELKNYLVSPEHVAGYLKGASDTIAEKTRLLETLRKEQHRVNQEVEHTFKLYYDGVLNAAQFKGVFQPLDIRKNQIHEELPRLEAEVDLLKIDGLSSEHIVEEIKTLHSRWPSLTREDRRRIVELLVKDIVIGNGEITLNLCYLPSFEEMTNRQRIV
jgi:site-specific DNA recombinase